MANSILQKIPGRNQSAPAKVAKAITKSAQYKTAKKTVDTASTPLKAGVAVAVGATAAASAVVLRKRGGGNPAQVGDADLTDPAVAAGV
jgi:hypothetical protein